MDDLLEARYKAQVIPELYPEIRQPVLKNWHPEDLAAYVGGPYTGLDTLIRRTEGEL